MKARSSAFENEESSARISRDSPPEGEPVSHGICPEHPLRVDKPSAQAALMAKASEGKGRNSAGRRLDRRTTRRSTHQQGGITEQYDYLWRNRWP